MGLEGDMTWLSLEEFIISRIYFMLSYNQSQSLSRFHIQLTGPTSRAPS
jgi:hypothetical protein